MQIKIPMPRTGKMPSWQEFIKIVHKSIGRKLGSGKIHIDHK